MAGQGVTRQRMKGQRKLRVKYAFGARHTRTIDPHNRHKQNVPHVVKEVIRISDVVLEILDSRFIDDTRHIAIEEEVKALGKKLVYVINKIDLVDIDALKASGKLEELKPYVLFSTTGKLGKRALKERIAIEAKRGNVDKHKISHVGVFGYPNTGKSSLINYLSGRGVAGISKQAGFTKGVQKIRLAKNLLLLDTPGIIPREEEDARAKGDNVEKHAKIGVETFDRVKNPELVVHNIMQENKGLLEKYYEIPEQEDSELFLIELGKKLNFLRQKGQIDTDRTARQVLKEWQLGKIKK